MKTLIVYYSRTGNIRILAKELAQNLSADMEELAETETKTGILGALITSKNAILQNLVPIQNLKHQPTNYDLVVIGTPVWAWNMSNPIRTFIEKYKASLKKVAFFASMGGSGDKRAFTNMEKLLGIAPIATISFTDNQIKNGAFKNELLNFVENVKKK